MTSMDQPSCAKTTGTTTISGYQRKERPRPENTKNSADWLQQKEQPENKIG